jgi:hypothetical protein
LTESSMHKIFAADTSSTYQQDQRVSWFRTHLACNNA